MTGPPLLGIQMGTLQTVSGPSLQPEASDRSGRQTHVSDLGIFGSPGDVGPHDIRFDPTDAAHLHTLGSGHIRIVVHAEPGLVDGRAVIKDGGAITSYSLEAVPTGRFTYWTTELGPFVAPLSLSLAFRDRHDRPVYLVPTGTSSAVERLDRWTIDPNAPGPDIPEWAQGAIIYQIFPDRFENGDTENDPPGTVPWDSVPHPRHFHGGDLDGIVNRLDHIERLGADAIYLNPIFRSPSNHRYDTVDYGSVDPALGGDVALRRLVDAAHSRGIRIVLDASFNHVHPDFFAFRDIVSNGPASEFSDWFVVHDWPPRIRHRPAAIHPYIHDPEPWLLVWKEETGLTIEQVDDPGPAVEPTYDAWFGVPTMPRLNLSHPDTRAHVLDVARYWLDEFDIDGWRMDVARYVDPDFWPEFRTVCKAVKPNAYLLAEIMGDVRPWLQGDRFDATMNYTFRDIALSFFARDETDGAAFLDHCARLYFRHPLPVTLANQNLLGSHDTPRFLTEAGGENWRLRLATIFQLTFPGAPGLYYGDEVAMSGANDPGCRGAFPWDEIGGASDHSDLVTELAELRRDHPALRIGDWRPLFAQDDLVVFRRANGTDRVTVAINRGVAARTVQIDETDTVLFGETELTGQGWIVPARAAIALTTTPPSAQPGTD